MVRIILPLLVAIFACKDIKIHPDFRVKEIRIGKGEPVKSSSAVVVNYEGRFKDGRVFDSSEMRGGPKKYNVNSPTLIDGWRAGLVGMKVGGKRELRIPPEMGFGEKGKAGRIPPNATLYFTIELLEIK